MPKTPSNTNSESTRFNPYISKSISKSLLTPCRQIGLSRKRKTPSSSNSVQNSPISVSGSSSDLDTTPVTSREITTNTSKTDRIAKDASAEKKSVSKCLISDDNTAKSPSNVIKEDTGTSNVKCDLLSEKLKKIKDVKKKSVIKDDSQSKDPETVELKKNKLVLNSDESNSDASFMKNSNSSGETSNVKCDSLSEKVKKIKDVKKKSVTKDVLQSKDSEIVELKKKKIVLNSDESNSDALFIKSSSLSDDVSSSRSSDDELIPLKYLKDQQLKKNSANASNIKEVILISSDEDNNPDLKQKDKSGPILSSKSDLKTKEKVKKMRRSFSLKSTDDDSEKDTEAGIVKDCIVRINKLPPDKEIENVPPVIDQDQINILEKQVQEKRKIVECLKQAEIYKRIHNVENLEQLTAIWKKGCISALNDLLPHLQKHAEIDMAQLLNNLRVPDNLITLSLNGDLI